MTDGNTPHGLVSVPKRKYEVLSIHAFSHQGYALRHIN